MPTLPPKEIVCEYAATVSVEYPARSARKVGLLRNLGAIAEIRARDVPVARVAANLVSCQIGVIETMSSGISDDSPVFDSVAEALRAAERDRDSLRKKNGVSLVSEAQDGTGLHRLPQGVYGFTYAPCMSDSPLFRKGASRTFEVHKHSGNEFLIGYLTEEGARQLQSATAAVELMVHPGSEGEAKTLVEVPLSRVLEHKAQTYRELGALQIRVAPIE